MRHICLQTNPPPNTWHLNCQHMMSVCASYYCSVVYNLVKRRARHAFRKYLQRVAWLLAVRRVNIISRHRLGYTLHHDSVGRHSWHRQTSQMLAKKLRLDRFLQRCPGLISVSMWHVLFVFFKTDNQVNKMVDTDAVRYLGRVVTFLTV